MDAAGLAQCQCTRTPCDVAGGHLASAVADHPQLDTHTQSDYVVDVCAKQLPMQAYSYMYNTVLWYDKKIPNVGHLTASQITAERMTADERPPSF